MKGKIRILFTIRVFGTEHDKLDAGVLFSEESQGSQGHIRALERHRGIQQPHIQGPTDAFAIKSGEEKITTIGNNRNIIFSGKLFHQCFQPTGNHDFFERKAKGGIHIVPFTGKDFFISLDEVKFASATVWQFRRQLGGLESGGDDAVSVWYMLLGNGRHFQERAAKGVQVILFVKNDPPGPAAQSFPEGKTALRVNDCDPMASPGECIAVAGNHPQSTGDAFKWYEKSDIHSRSLLNFGDI